MTCLSSTSMHEPLMIPFRSKHHGALAVWGNWMGVLGNRLKLIEYFIDLMDLEIKSEYFFQSKSRSQL